MVGARRLLGFTLLLVGLALVAQPMLQPDAAGEERVIVADPDMHQASSGGERTLDARVEARTEATVAGETVEAETGADPPDRDAPDATPQAAPGTDEARSAGVQSPDEVPTTAGATTEVSYQAGVQQLDGGPSDAQGSRAVVRQVVPDDAQEAVSILGILMSIAGLGVAYAEALKPLLAKGITFVAPLFSRLDPQDLLDNPVRRRILELVREEPGISASELSRRVDVSWGTTIYHLNRLEDEHLVTSMREGRHRRFFQNGGTHAPDEREVLATLRNDTTAQVLDTVRSEPGLAQKEIAQRVDMSPSALAWHIKRLHEADLVTKERDGRRVRYFQGETVPPA